MKIFQAVTSPFAVRVRIALYAKGVTPEFGSCPGAWCKSVALYAAPGG